MIGFSQSNDLSSVFISSPKDRSMAYWPDQSPSNNDFCDEIDEIMKHEDVILLDDSLSATPLDLDLDTISDLLETPSPSTPMTNFSQPLDINGLPTPSTGFSLNSHSQSHTNASAYSSLGISPQFNTLSLHNNPLVSLQQYFQSNNLHLPAHPEQQDQSILATSYPFELPCNSNGPSDVKRFRSASMNDGPSLQESKLAPNLFDPRRFKATAYDNSSTYPHKISSPAASSNVLWPLVSAARPVSNSFSEADNQQQQTRLGTANLSSSYGGDSPAIYIRNRTRLANERNFPSPTLYTLNQSAASDTTPPPTRKRLSLVDYPVVEIKDDPVSPDGTIEQPTEPDLWSDIEQNSSDHLQENELTSDGDEDDDDDDHARHTAAAKGEGNAPSSSSLFWQYNVQSKGPKTRRILYLKERDPHIAREFSDPVYQIKLTQTKGHALNKLRKGDGNDVTPNPMKLYQLGKQIRDLSNNSSSLYHGIYHVDQHTNSNDTAEVKKEKNKIASRACRLRKKAQHEANKLKLQGLNEEHRALIDIIASIKLMILQRYQDGQRNSPPSSSIEVMLDQLMAKKNNHMVAGNTDGFVQAIINEMEQAYDPKQ